MLLEKQFPQLRQLQIAPHLLQTGDRFLEVGHWPAPLVVKVKGDLSQTVLCGSKGLAGR